VLLFGDGDTIKVGAPLLAGGKVSATVENTARAKRKSS
jgi:ribosomal protein L21